MSRPLKCSKLSEAEEQEKNMDRISSLPDELLAHVLSFLPTKCAVGTSILSTRWRSRHMMTNCLSFDVPYMYLENEIKAQKKKFKKFVNKVLLLHKTPINKFHLSCGQHTYDDSLLHSWISSVIMKGVEKVHLSINCQLNALPHCLFSCQTIVEMKISSCIKGFRVPDTTYLPSLKILHLCNLQFLDTDSLAMFVSACSLLQELQVDQCEWPMDSDRYLRLSSSELKHVTIIYSKGRVEVDAPNLAYLQYYNTDDEDVGLSLKKSDHLVTASIEFSFTDNSDLIQLGLALIKAVYHVKDLHLGGAVLQYLTRFEDDQIPSYPNLISLKLGHCWYDTWKYITYWLANSPRLETLVFEQSLISDTTREEKWPPNVALVPFSSRLNVIEASDFRGYTTELVLLRYLLRNAKVLKKLILNKDLYGMTTKQELQASKKLLMLPRASKSCVIQLRKEIQPVRQII